MDGLSERDRRQRYLESELRRRFGTDVDVWQDAVNLKWCAKVRGEPLESRQNNIGTESRYQGDQRILSAWLSELEG